MTISERAVDAQCDKLTYGEQVFSDRERSSLLSDAMSLARAGLLSYQTALDLTSYLPHQRPCGQQSSNNKSELGQSQSDTDLLVWDVIVRTFDYITSQLYNDPDFALWQACRRIR